MANRLLNGLSKANFKLCHQQSKVIASFDKKRMVDFRYKSKAGNQIYFLSKKYFRNILIAVTKTQIYNYKNVYFCCHAFPLRGGGWLFRPLPNIFYDKIVFLDTLVSGLVGKLTKWEP